MRNWPLYGLRLRTPRLELRLPTPAELDDLADVAGAGLHGPDEMPFGTPWSSGTPDQVRAAVLQRHWRTLATWSPEEWNLQLAVFLEGRPVGVQLIRSVDFPIVRNVNTGSWLGITYQGKGLGTEMRAAVLELGFHGLAAQTATSGAYGDNPSSQAVTLKLGYRRNGITFEARGGNRVEEHAFILDRATWQANRTVETEIEGLTPCLHQFGLPDRRPLLEEDLKRHQAEHGAFTEEEMSEADARIASAVASAQADDQAL